MVDKKRFSEQLVSMKDYVALAIVNVKKYQQINVDIIKSLTDKGVPGVYVTLNKPFEIMQRLFKQNKIDERFVIFIDGITKVPGNNKKIKNCLFIESPEKLSDISVAMDQAVNALPTKKKFIFLDAVTEVSTSEIKKTKACLFIGSPENLSDISIAIDQAVTAIPSKDKFLFFDSLNTLLIYNDVRVVAQFIHFLANKMRTWKIRGIIISLKKESDKELIDELSQICDLTADLR